MDEQDPNPSDACMGCMWAIVAFILLILVLFGTILQRTIAQ